MKANYTKPQLTVELLTLTQSVARDCAENSIPKEQINFNDPRKCVWDLGGDAKVFVEASGCTINGENMDVACYNNPSEGNYVFRS